MATQRASDDLPAIGGADDLMRVLTYDKNVEHEAEIDPGFVWMTDATLSIVILGATGDLASKKTFPALLNLFSEGLIPRETIIYGYGRSNLSEEAFRELIRPNLLKRAHNQVTVDRFLNRVFYHVTPDFGSIQPMEEMMEKIEEFENSVTNKPIHHRLFYLAIPPDVYTYAALAIQATGLHDTGCKEGDKDFKGFCRIILEKPLGHDLPSFQKLNSKLNKHFTEDQMFRIDHFLGKEMVQNLAVLRFSNRWLEKVWNRDNVQCVIITKKDPRDITNRGDYFDRYGIIRDIIQNHLFQILCLVAMEAPQVLDGPESAKAIRDAKMAVLNAITEISPDDVLTGQYEGYLEDPSVTNKESTTPTFAAMRIFINTPRWEGVPFVLKTGKAMDSDKAEIRIQFKDAKGARTMFSEGEIAPRNEFGT